MIACVGLNTFRTPKKPTNASAAPLSASFDRVKSASVSLPAEAARLDASLRSASWAALPKNDMLPALQGSSSGSGRRRPVSAALCCLFAKRAVSGSLVDA